MAPSVELMTQIDNSSPNNYSVM